MSIFVLHIIPAGHITNIHIFPYICTYNINIYICKTYILYIIHINMCTSLRICMFISYKITVVFMISFGFRF